MTVYHNIKPRPYVVVKVYSQFKYFYDDILSRFYIMIYSHLYLLLLYDLQTFGIPQRAHLLNVPSIWLMNWPDDGSMSRNMLPDL